MPLELESLSLTLEDVAFVIREVRVEIYFVVTLSWFAPNVHGGVSDTVRGRNADDSGSPEGLL